MCVFVCVLRLYPAAPGSGVSCGCLRLCSGLGCASTLPAGVLGCLCVCVRASPVPRDSWLGRAVRVCLLGLRFQLHPASPRWGVGVSVFVSAIHPYPARFGSGVRCGCVRLGSGLGCAPPLLAGVLACVCVFVCVLCLYPATPGWGARCESVRLGTGFRCAPPLLAGVLGCACVFVCVLCSYPAIPGQPVWCGCVFGLGFWLRPATPGWDVWLCVFLCARSACTPPLLAGARAAGVCAWAWVLAAPRLSWLGCWVVCVFVCLLCLYPPLLAGVCSVGVCAWARGLAAPRHSWLGCWGVCVFLRVLRLCPATPGWNVRCGRACVGSGFGCAPPLLAGVLRSVCVCVRTQFVPPNSWLGCAVWVCMLWAGYQLCPPLLAWVWGVCVFLCGFRLYNATPDWGVCSGCVCSGSGCPPPLLGGVHVCVCVRAPLVPRHCRLERALCGLGVAWHLFLCRGSLQVVRAARVCGKRWHLSLGACPRTLVFASSLPLGRAWWLHVGALRLVRSGRSRCSGRLS